MTVTDPEVVAEARKIAQARAGSKAHLKTPEKAVVRTLVARAVAEGWDQATLAKRLEQSVGLDARFTTAVETYRKGLLAKGMAPGRAQREAKKYAGRLRAYRANLIARQEQSEAVGEAQRTVWADRQIAKVYSRWAVRVFRVHKDERLCPVCRPMNGRRASLRHGSLYKGTPHAGPPLHVGCRCREEILDEGLVKTDPDLWGPSEEEIAKRAQPRVRTQAGVRRYGLPLLAPIVARPHGYPDLDDDARESLDRMLDDGRPHVRAFGFAVRDVLDRYPALSAYIARVAETDGERSRDDPPYVAFVGPDRGRNKGKFLVAVSDRHMQGAFKEFEEKTQTPEGQAYFARRGMPNRATMSGPDAERYAYAVGIHEMGHVAHAHFIASGLRYARTENIRRYEENGHRLNDQPVVSEYAQRSAMEKFAEWFAGNLLGLNPGNDERFKAEFEAAMAKRAVWAETMYVVKGQHMVEDFKGSVVERYALGKGTALGLVSKARQRRVATIAGVKHFKLPIGAPIIARLDRDRSEKQQARITRIATLVQGGKKAEALALLDRDLTLDPDDKADIKRRIGAYSPSSQKPKASTTPPAKPSASPAGQKAPAATGGPPKASTPQKPAQQSPAAPPAKAKPPTPVQERALYAYIGVGTALSPYIENEFRGEGGGQFDVINWDLRGGYDPLPTQDRMIRELTALAEANRNHGGIKVQRGAAPFGIFDLDQNDDLTGTVFRDLGFVSASKDPKVAAETFDRRDTEGHVLFEYEIPDGHPALDVNSLLGKGVIRREQEVILLPGQAFEITGDSLWQTREGKTPQRKVTLRLTEAP